MVMRWGSETPGLLDLLRKDLLSVLLGLMELGLQCNAYLLGSLSLSLLLSLDHGLNLVETRFDLLKGLQVLLLAPLVAQLNFLKKLLGLGSIFSLLLLEDLLGF